MTIKVDSNIPMMTPVMQPRKNISVIDLVFILWYGVECIEDYKSYHHAYDNH